MKLHLYNPPITVLPGQVVETKGDKYRTRFKEHIVCVGEVVEIDSDIAAMKDHELMIYAQKLRGTVKALAVQLADE